MKRLTDPQRFRYERLLKLIEVSQQPIRINSLYDFGTYQILRTAFEFLADCGVAEKTEVLLSTGGRAFEYQCIRTISVDEYINHINLTGVRQIVEQKPVVGKASDPKIKIEGHVMTVRECHPGRIERKSKYGIIGSSLSAFV